MLIESYYFDDIEIKLNLEYELLLKIKLDSNLELNVEEEYYKNYIEDYNKKIIEEKEKKEKKEDKDEENLPNDNKILNNFYIKLRKNRSNIPDSFIIKKFLIGDILEFVYFFKNLALTFSGICIAMRKKAFLLPDVSLILRNIIVKTGVEVVISYFYNRAYKMIFLDYKRKFYTFNKNKLYFVRERLNRESRIN